jgi:hypothetical protein
VRERDLPDLDFQGVPQGIMDKERLIEISPTYFAVAFGMLLGREGRTTLEAFKDEYFPLPSRDQWMRSCHTSGFPAQATAYQFERGVGLRIASS